VDVVNVVGTPTDMGTLDYCFCSCTCDCTCDGTCICTCYCSGGGITQVADNFGALFGSRDGGGVPSETISDGNSRVLHDNISECDA